jgi:hypothetical protein
MLWAVAPFDLRQRFIDDGIFRERFAEGRIQPLQQIGDRFIVPAHQRDTDFLPFRRQGRAANRRYFTNGDLTAGVVEESLDVFEGPVGINLNLVSKAKTAQ